MYLLCYFAILVRVFRFNETCCEERGVPEDCMGLCREKQRTKRSAQYPVDKCVEHEEKITQCMYEGNISKKASIHYCRIIGYQLKNYSYINNIIIY